MSEMSRKTVLVVGATGFIGGEIAVACTNAGAKVIGMARRGHMLHGMVVDRYLASYLTVDVTNINQLSKASLECPVLDAIVYSVGDVGAGRMKEIEIRDTVDITGEDILADVSRHCIGLHNVLISFHRLLNPGGVVLVVGSMINRLYDIPNIPSLFTAHLGYSIANAAKEKVVRVWRIDREIRKLKVQIRQMRLSSVDTPFWEGARYQPPYKIPLAEVGKRAIGHLTHHPQIDIEEDWSGFKKSG
jgi:NAD(P)-dependent dehydrogenase (short-subunit alcohol dehydrogenase family)